MEFNMKTRKRKTDSLDETVLNETLLAEPENHQRQGISINWAEAAETVDRVFWPIGDGDRRSGILAIS